MSFSRIRGQDALAALIWSLAFVTTAGGEDLFSFQFQKRLAFVVPSRDLHVQFEEGEGYGQSSMVCSP
jgi:hypothetical protein